MTEQEGFEQLIGYVADTGNRFFEYGGMKQGQNTKVHISDIDGSVLCGVSSFWMQQYNEILNSGEVHADYGIGNIKDFDCVCKKCLKKWTALNVCQHPPKEHKPFQECS